MFTARRITAFAVAALIATGLAACNNSDDDSNSGSGSGGGSSSSEASGTIALLLPETATTRYESFDKPFFEAKVKELCPKCNVVYQNANQQADQQRSQAQSVLAQGAKVLVLDPVNGETAGSIVTLAKGKNVPVIAYDRLIAKADLDYYVTFDNEKVGEAQGKALVEKLKADGKTSGKIVMINGDRKDNNALQFNKGAHSALDGSGFTLEPTTDFFTPDWKPANAQNFMNAQIARLGKTGFVGVYAANDGTAGGAIAAMRSNGVSPLPPVTGQDSELAAIQRILAGDQYMTIFKSYQQEAEKAAEVAVELLKGNKPSGDTTVNNQQKDVPSSLLDVVAVTKENVKDTVIANKLWTAAQVCTGQYAAACTSAGIS